MGDPDILFGGFSTMMILLGVGGMVGLIRWSGWYFHPEREARMAARGKKGGYLPVSDERVKALEIYRQLVSQKLDVVRSALEMGYSEAEIEKLDARLEKLIGKDALAAVVRGEAPLPVMEDSFTEIAAERMKLKESMRG